ncbi:hypothetical protein [Nonomuraea sp. NPDC050643]
MACKANIDAAAAAIAGLAGVFMKPPDAGSVFVTGDAAAVFAARG